MVEEKVNKIRRLLYVHPGKSMSHIDVFWVPKGSTDIRLVYNGTSCGLNEVLWAPWFALPGVRSHLRSVEAGTFLGDIDIGDQFHNFMMHSSVQPYVGVDYAEYDFNVKQLGPLSSVLENSTEKRNAWNHAVGMAGGETFGRQCMGLRPSPYNCVQMMHRATPKICGNMKKQDNPFAWEKVVLNLPGMDAYQCHRPRVYKIRVDGSIAADLIWCVDDGRGAGPNDIIYWEVLQCRKDAFVNGCQCGV